MLKKNKNSQTLNEEELLQQKREKTAQHWMPMADIEGPIVYHKDNHISGMLRVQPENIDLLSDKEKRRKIDALAEGFNGENEPFQIFCVGRPVDLNNYLEMLQEKAKMEQDFTRKMVLKGYIQHTSKLASSGEAIERRFYIIFTKKIKDSKTQSELINRLNEFQIKLSSAELSSSICYEDELMDVFSLFANPVQAAFERTELEYDLPSIIY